MTSREALVVSWIVVLQVVLAFGIGGICWWLLGIVREARHIAQRMRCRPPDDRET